MRVLIGFAILSELVSLTLCSPKLNGRIVGGTATNIISFPYQLSLKYFQIHICGASILSRTFGVTAAHCVEGKIIRGLSVYAGNTQHSSGGTSIGLSTVKLHELYNNDTSDYDIALIQFATPLLFKKSIAPVTLPTAKYKIPTGTVGFTTGWGYPKEDATEVSDTLLAVLVTVVERKRCGRLYSGKGLITPRMLCAGHEKGGRDACQGDSGGPFTVNGVLLGIVSWGYGCARPGYPGVYTNVAELRNWIKQHANV